MRSRPSHLGEASPECAQITLMAAYAVPAAVLVPLAESTLVTILAFVASGTTS
ncbi:hypothetical protein [Kibdelosporangium philippinense]|uniref:hypothetical protein n=1 Tax=Kibdelosporangium philippinense TaxID=211113 RepID=UPI00360610D9